MATEIDLIAYDKMAETLGPYGVDLTPPLHSQILAYLSLLQRWNRRIALTTVTESFEILRFHFGESFFAAGSVPILKGRLADVGSGAGFPGVPLKMLRPELYLTLIEANLKKCAFLSETIRSLDLDHVTVVRGRMEDYATGHEKFDYITARAVGQTGDLLRFADASLKTHGKVILWIGENSGLEDRMERDWQWETGRRIPGADRRFLLVGTKAW